MVRVLLFVITAVGCFLSRLIGRLFGHRFHHMQSAAFGIAIALVAGEILACPLRPVGPPPTRTVTHSTNCHGQTEAATVATWQRRGLFGRTITKTVTKTVSCCH